MQSKWLNNGCEGAEERREGVGEGVGEGGRSICIHVKHAALPLCPAGVPSVRLGTPLNN